MDKIIVKNISKVKGLYYVSNIINNQEELIKQLDDNEWKSLSNSANSRVVQHYGYLYDYKTRNINIPTTPFPDFIQELANLLTDICMQIGLIDEKYKFNQCIVNNYNAGQGISRHTDIKTYGKVIGCFTICSGATMKFFNPLDNSNYDKYVEANSLYIMSGDARYIWTHEMLTSKFDIVNKIKVPRGRRISITFRNVP
jgi:alkylated DNA repair dioxygenase AlkB